jgi:uncharacterized protein YqeY
LTGGVAFARPRFDPPQSAHYVGCMLAKEIKQRMFAAMKAKSTVEKEILRVALGEIDTQSSRSGKDLTDDEVVAVLRKLVKSNHESIKVLADEARKAELQQEIEVLETLLPKTLDADAIVAALEPVADAIKGAGNDGQATGVAMKHLKSSGAAVEGKTVAAAVRKIRA